MLRINRNNGRVGADGIYRTWQKIEEKYAEMYEGKIKDNLNEAIRVARSKSRREFLRYCLENVHAWLLAQPEDLQNVKEKEIDTRLGKLNEKDRRYVLNKIKWAYNYRENRPIVLAKWLNVKACPYCNMQYTLYAGDKETGEKALFEFDHFLPQSKYPMFSMSLYNLIPSCSVCNNGKREKEWSMDYHPYHASIGEKISFRVKNLLPLLVAREDEIEIETEHPKDENWNDYEASTHLEAIYKRHTDVAREIFGRAYAYKYYKEYPIPGLRGDKEFAERVLKEFYPDKEDIDKRPLTKFEQDIWEQAEKLYDDIEIPERER